MLGLKILTKSADLNHGLPILSYAICRTQILEPSYVFVAHQVPKMKTISHLLPIINTRFITVFKAVQSGQSSGIFGNNPILVSIFKKQLNNCDQSLIDNCV